MANELDKTIEELEAEVLSELEEANGADAPMKSAGKADKSQNAKFKIQDTCSFTRSKRCTMLKKLLQSKRSRWRCTQKGRMVNADKMQNLLLVMYQKAKKLLQKWKWKYLKLKMRIMAAMIRYDAWDGKMKKEQLHATYVCNKLNARRRTRRNRRRKSKI